MKAYSAFREQIGLARIGNQSLPPVPAQNPFKKGSRAWNLTAQFEIQRRDPALAARLKTLADQ